MPLCDTRHCDSKPRGSRFQFWCWPECNQSKLGKVLKPVFYPVLINEHIRQYQYYWYHCMGFGPSSLCLNTCRDTNLFTSSNLPAPFWPRPGQVEAQPKWSACVSLWALLISMLLSVVLCAEETVPHIIHIHSMPVEISAKWAAARSVPPCPAPPSCSFLLCYSHFLFLLLYVYRSGLISGALICSFNPLTCNSWF